MQRTHSLRRNDSRIIIHFDYDCFYASVVENENPALKSVPLAIQQKQIIVTCNYEARRRGLHKLQLITEAKKVCPEVVIVLGEDISRFRDVSKDLYQYITQATWNGRAERLGFDEVWLDCTDMVDHNYDLLNQHDLTHSFFCLDKNDPTQGFEYDASSFYGPIFPDRGEQTCSVDRLSEPDCQLRLRLLIGSHLAKYLRHELETNKGYTATVGISTNKILSKLIGNINKPQNQTTLIPPYDELHGMEGTVTHFLDTYDIGKVPGIGFKLAQKIRAYILGRTAEIDAGLVYGGTKESVSIRDVRLYPGMSADVLEEILSGPGSQKGIGARMWSLLHGIDDTEVGKMKRVPSQISQEDSYMKYLHSFDQVRQQLALLAERLIRRMHIDLVEDDDFGEGVKKRWLAHPRTLRLSTRPRPPLNADGSRTRTFHRISRSAPMPSFTFSLNETVSVLAEKLVDEALVPMFRRLHPERNGWNLSLINVAVTNMAETAADSKDSNGRDIGKMFRRQDDVLKDYRVTTLDPHDGELDATDDKLREAAEAKQLQASPKTEVDLLGADEWQSDEEATDELHHCPYCQASVPFFAADAHLRYHTMTDREG